MNTSKPQIRVGELSGDTGKPSSPNVRRIRTEPVAAPTAENWLGTMGSWLLTLVVLGCANWIWVGTGFVGIDQGPGDLVFSCALQLAFVVTAVAFLRQVRNLQVSALLLFYSLLVVTFIGGYAATYLTLNYVDAHAFQQPFGRFEAVYLAWGTFTPASGATVAPADNAARALVLSESFAAWILIGIGLAIVVSRLTAAKRGA